MSVVGSATLDRWQKTLGEIDSCPWAGPRPLRYKADKDQFVGRDDDTKTFVDRVLDHSLVILSAESGVGKTSLLEMGLKPGLTAAGYTPFYYDEWTASGGGGDAGFNTDRFFFDHFRRELGLPVGDWQRFDVWLDETYGSEGILILDQFEEAIRDHPDMLEPVIGWIAESVAKLRFKVVISLRSEYVHKLRGLRDRVGPWDLFEYELAPVTNEADIIELIESGNGVRPGVIDEGATDAVVTMWKQRSSRAAAPSLLEVQALLYALYWMAHENKRSIDTDTVSKFAGGATAGTREKGLDPFAYALDRTVAQKLDLCMAAMEGSDASSVPEPAWVGDTYLRDGTRGVVEQIVQHLSSGGYKLLRDEWELAQRALSRELSLLLGPASGAPSLLAESGDPDRFRRLRPAATAWERRRARQKLAESGAEKLFRQVGNLVSESSTRIAVEDLAGDGGDRLRERSDLLTSRLDIQVSKEYAQWMKSDLEGNPWEVDGGEVSSGPMLGMNPLFILAEEFRRFHFGIQWLEKSDLVRTSSPVPNRRMVSLIHDGFGKALNHWVANRSGNPASEIARLTASRGETLNWVRWYDDEVWPEFDGKTITNVRWRDCEIRARFNGTTFLNCDFRGSRFTSCTFEGVTFINCLLDGAAVVDSAVVGPVSEFREPYPKNVPPSFEVPFDPERLESLARYRGISTNPHGGRLRPESLISHTSGIPAVPMDDEHEHVFPKDLTDGQPWRFSVPEETGGLAMYGGRVCSLRLHRTRFVDGGKFAVRLVSGSALDLVEHAEGELNIDIYGSAIRGLTITGLSAGRSPHPVQLALVSDDAVLADTWFGDGLEGTATFANCQIWQMMSLSEREDFATSFVDDCAYYGLVNVGDLAGSTLIEGFSSSGMAKRSEIVPVGERMDYESDPARSEFERRLRETPDRLWPPLTRIATPRE